MVLSTTGVAIPVSATATFTEIVRTGDVEPGGTSTFAEGLETPVLGDNGEAIFGSNFRDNGFADGNGLLRSDASGSPVMLLRTPDPTPGLDGNYGGFFLPSLAPDGEALVGGFIQSSLIANGGLGLYQVAGSDAAVPGVVTERARTGADTTDQGNLLFQIAFSGLSAPQRVASGNSYFFGTTLGSTPTLRVTPTGDLQEAFRAGESLPEFSGVTVSQNVPRMAEVNDRDELALYGRLLDLGGNGITAANNEAILMKDDTQGLRRVVSEGQATPDGNGTFGNAPGVLFFQVFADPSLNNRGDVAFASQVLGSAGGSIDDDGVFRRLADGTVSTLARGGDFVPNGNGRLSDVVVNAFERTFINDRGSVAFRSGITGATGGPTAGLFLHTDADGLTEVARLNGNVPDGAGTFSFLDTFALNDHDQVAFLTLIDDGGFSNDTALMFYDPVAGLQTVARVGDTLGGGTITDLRFNPTVLSQGADRDGLNNRGQLAFQATIAGQFVNFIWDAGLTAALLGDYNNDGSVDQGDLDLVLLNWGDDASVTGVPSGWINDAPAGLIGQSELDAVLLNWGNTAEPDDTSVPEPAMLAVLSALGLNALRVRPRR